MTRVFQVHTISVFAAHKTCILDAARFVWRGLCRHRFRVEYDVSLFGGSNRSYPSRTQCSGEGLRPPHTPLPPVSLRTSGGDQDGAWSVPREYHWQEGLANGTCQRKRPPAALDTLQGIRDDPSRTQRSTDNPRVVICAERTNPGSIG